MELLGGLVLVVAEDESDCKNDLEFLLIKGGVKLLLVLEI